MARKSRKNIDTSTHSSSTHSSSTHSKTTYNTSTQHYNTAFYLRLSAINKKHKSNDSIENQQELLKNYISANTNLVLKKIYIDNGQTGVNFDRPAWNNLMQECRQGNINCIVIKDLSRLGRNYIETGDYLERILPALGVRLIAVNDNYDNLNISGNSRLIFNIKNLVNDIYSKDISRKVIASMRTMQKRGEFLGGFAAYGYLKDPLNPKKIVVNDETAPIVHRIFEMKAAGLGNGTICKILNSENIPCPLRYRYIKGLSRSEKYNEKYNDKFSHCIWITSTISIILRNPLYLGHMTQGKVRVTPYCQKYNQKYNRKTKRSEWIIVPDTHEAIVSKELFERANAILDERSGSENRFNI